MAKTRTYVPTTDTSVVGHPGRLRSWLWADVCHATTAASLGCLAVAAVDYAATLWAAPEGVGTATALRLLLLELALVSLFALLAVPVLATAEVGVRLLIAALDPAKARSWKGFTGPAPRADRPRGAAPWLWALVLGGGAYLGASTVLTLRIGAMFREPQLTALVLSFVQLGVFGALGLLTFFAARRLRRLGLLLHPRLGRLGWLNPFGSVPAAAVTLALLAILPVRLTLSAMPQLGPEIPWRHLVALGAFALGVYGSTRLLAARGRLWPEDGRRRLIAVAATVFVLALLLPVALFRVGADAETKSLALSSSPPMRDLIDGVRWANDFDGDGFGSLLGENDCGPFDPDIHPLARDIPDNGRDENCDGDDFQLGTLPTYRRGERLPVPDAYQRDWNFLLVTVDTVRYDHTTMGGYDEREGRNTTPELARLAERSANFVFANAPSAGTMASVPAILTSKFFHSGIALDEDVKRGMPPRLKPENTLISEILKEKDYSTGAILSHYYFNDWGLEQGFDTYDNSVGAKNDPYAVTSDRLTDRAIAWIGKHTEKKWFLWVHYIDPHGRYVTHPGEEPYGTSEMDLYDGELRFTDKHLGRLFDYIVRSNVRDRTVIVVTSDHGDAFKEHGFINHGQDLYREILHVPLIFYVPNIEPRDIAGAVSPIDIVPTIADLVGADVSDLGLEGESLVPQLFYGRDAHDRVVFAETNYRNHLRAAVTSRYKLIRNLQANVYRLFDLEEDPWEKKNVWSRKPKAFEEMKGYLNDWLERVYYTRDPNTNQAMAKLRDFIVRQPPDDATPIEAVSFDEGRIEVVGLETDKERYRSGEMIKMAVYFRVVKRPSADFRIQVEAWPADDPGKGPAATSKLRFTAKGLLATSHWRDGEHVRDRFGIRIPRAWAEAEERTLRIGIRMARGKRRDRLTPTGPTRKTDDQLVIIGDVTLEAAGAPSPSRTQPRRRD